MTRILLEKARALSKLRRGSPKYTKALAKFKHSFGNLQREQEIADGSRSNTNVVVS